VLVRIFSEYKGFEVYLGKKKNDFIIPRALYLFKFNLK